MITFTPEQAKVKPQKINCPKCGQTVLIRKDGKISLHKIRRRYRSQHLPLEICPWAGKPFTPEQERK